MPLTTNTAESSNITQQRNSSSNIFLHSLTVALNLTIQRNYYSYENGIIFAFSKKQAQRLCDSLKISFNYKVYGVSQKQLKMLLDLLALYSKHIHVLIPIDKEARQLIELDNKDLLDCYVREENG